METTFIYFLKDPENPKRGYVGKSNRPKKRFNAHLNKAEKNCKTDWVTTLKARGLAPILEILDEVPAEHWQQWEVAYIEFFLEQGFDLVNGTAGGDGQHNPSPKTRKKMSAAKAGEKGPCFGKFGAQHPAFGHKATPEAITKRKEYRAKQTFSPESLAKRRTKKPGASSNFYGVCRGWRIGKWLAFIAPLGKRINLGVFDNEDAAAWAYDTAAKIHYGEFAKLNFPD